MYGKIAPAEQGWGKDLASWGSPARRSLTRGGQLLHPSGLWPLKSPAPGRKSPTGPARSPDHPLARQGLDIGILSPPELRVAVRESLEEIQGTVAGRRGRWKQLMSTTWILLLAHFTNVETEAWEGGIIFPGLHSALCLSLAI